MRIAGALALMLAGLWASDARAKDGEPWNGGKQTAPAEVRADLPARVIAGKALQATIVVTPTRDCVTLETRVRGVDGVDVRASAWQRHKTCEAGRAVRVPVTLVASAGRAGLVTVDLRLDVGGRTVESSRAFDLRAPGAAPANKPHGRLERDSTGRLVVVLPSRGCGCSALWAGGGSCRRCCSSARPRSAARVSR